MEVDREILNSINTILVELEISPNVDVIDFAEKFPELGECIDYLQEKLYH